MINSIITTILDPLIKRIIAILEKYEKNPRRWAVVIILLTILFSACLTYLVFEDFLYQKTVTAILETPVTPEEEVGTHKNLRKLDESFVFSSSPGTQPQSPKKQPQNEQTPHQPDKSHKKARTSWHISDWNRCPRPNNANITNVKIKNGDEVAIYGIASRTDFTYYLIYWQSSQTELPPEYGERYEFHKKVMREGRLQTRPLNELDVGESYLITLRVFGNANGQFQECSAYLSVN